MILAAVIRRENQILLQRISEFNNQSVWELPNCEVSDGDNTIDSLAQKCKKLNVTIELTDIFYMEELDNPSKEKNNIFLGKEGEMYVF